MITAEADRVIHVRAPEYLAHIELQSTYKADMGPRILLYNALAYSRYRLPVQSVLVLLRREADGPAMSGQVSYAVPQSADGALSLKYRVARVWEKTAEEVLSGSLATLPLAPLTEVSANALPQLVRQMEARIDAEAVAEEVGMLWTATYLLMGLKYETELTSHLLKGVRAMKESVTYQAILEEGAERGRLEGELRAWKKMLLRNAIRRFGAPDARALAALEAIESPDVMEALIDRVDAVESWNDLLPGKRAE